MIYVESHRQDIDPKPPLYRDTDLYKSLVHNSNLDNSDPGIVSPGLVCTSWEALIL